MIIEDFDSKAFDFPTEKFSDAEGIQKVCTRLQKYMLAMAKSSYNIAREDLSDAEKLSKAISVGEELMNDYCEQLQIYSEWLSEHAIEVVNHTIESILERTILMDDEERVDFLSLPSIFIDTRSCDLEDIARQHGEQVAEYIRGVQLKHQQQQMTDEINSLINGGSVTASESDKFIRMTQKHEDVQLLKKKN